MKERLQTRKIIDPSNDLKIGAQVAQWNDKPSEARVLKETHGRKYESETGKILDEDVQEARYICL